MSLRGGFGTLIWMKKPVIIVSFIVFLLVSFLYVFASNNGFRACDLELDKVCFDKELEQYQIEENAVLTIEVNSIEYGEAIKQLWNQVHPNQNSINYVLIDETNTADLMFGTANELALKYDSLMIMEENIQNRRSDISQELNMNGLKFLPLIGEGFAFITNKTELERLVGSWEDSNNNNLHDSFESIESIVNAQANWETDSRALVISLSEPFTLYPYITSSGWRLFEELDSYSPGFEKESFLDSLKFIELLSSVNWNKSEGNLAETYTWDYPDALYNDDFIFSQVSTWMFYDEMDSVHESEWVISSFPKAYETSKESLHSLLTSVSGYALNMNTLYPSAAHELLRLIYSIKGLQVKINTDRDILISDRETLDQLIFNREKQKQFSFAFLEAQSESLIAMEEFPSELATQVFYEIDFENTIQKLWNKEISIQEAQIEIALKSDEWIMRHSKMFEGKLKNE